MTTAVQLHFKKAAPNSDQTIAIVKLDRPDVANAFNGEMLEELTAAFIKIAAQENCRTMVLCSSGKHFCAGADLNWMKASAQLTFDQNTDEARSLTKMFEALAGLPIPTVAVVQGTAFGGAVGLITACDLAIASEDAKLCLSEVKIGLIPAVILPYVARKMAYGQLRRFSLSGQIADAQTALSIGLVERVVAADQLNQAVTDELNALLSASPAAQTQLKKLIVELADESFTQTDRTAKAIARVRTSQQGQAGLESFLTKKQAPWVIQLASDWTWKP